MIISKWKFGSWAVTEWNGTFEPLVILCAKVIYIYIYHPFHYILQYISLAFAVFYISCNTYKLLLYYYIILIFLNIKATKKILAIVVNNPTNKSRILENIFRSGKRIDMELGLNISEIGLLICSWAISQKSSNFQLYVQKCGSKLWSETFLIM